MQNFEQIRSAIQGQHNITVRDPYMICVELSLDQGSRHQSIFLAEIEDDDGRKYLRVSTVIAPMADVDARRMLDFNWHSRVGYMAVGELDSVPYLQLCENRPYDNLTASEVDRLILEIGGIGDNLERMLSPDADLL